VIVEETLVKSEVATVRSLNSTVGPETVTTDG
jgi:hypothetical protein